MNNAMTIELKLLLEDYGEAESSEIGTVSLTVPPATSLGQVRHLASNDITELLEHTNVDPWAKNPRHWILGMFQSRTGQFHELWEMDILGQQGEIIFNQPVEDITVDELCGVAQAALLPFELNPKVVGLWCPEGLGNGDELPLILRYWSDFNFWLATVIASAIGNVLVECAKSLQNVIGERWREYRDRKAAPWDVLRQILLHREWDVEELVVRFQVERDEARRLLVALGYSPSQSRIDRYTASHSTSEAVATMVLEHPQIRALLEIDPFDHQTDS